MNTLPPPLVVRGLHKQFATPHGIVHAVRDLNLTIAAGRSTALVGESGCGKTTSAFCIAGLQEADAGTVRLGGADFSGASRSEQQRLRRHFGIVFQNPLAALNPRLRIWQNVAEPLRAHEPALGKLAQEERTAAMLTRVGLDKQHLRALPRQLSGGQLQRVVLARALILEPRLVILDEPTSALDVSVQAQVLALLQQMQDDLALSYLFITHNLALVETLADTVMVMYAGRVVEAGPSSTVFTRPRHPYTRELIASIPEPTPAKRQMFRAIDAQHVPPQATGGCAFRLRCPHAQADCAAQLPPLGTEAHAVACLHPLSQE